MYQGITQELNAVMVEAKRSGLFTAMQISFLMLDGSLNAAGGATGTLVVPPSQTIGGVVYGYTSLPCMVAPPSVARLQATEVKALEEIMSVGLRHVLIQSYVPGIVAGWQCNIVWTSSGYTQTYDVLGSEPDSQSKMTRVQVRLATI